MTAQTKRALIHAKTDQQIRDADFWVGREKVTREECAAEMERRKKARAYAEQQRARGDIR